MFSRGQPSQPSAQCGLSGTLTGPHWLPRYVLIRLDTSGTRYSDQTSSFQIQVSTVSGTGWLGAPSSSRPCCRDRTATSSCTPGSGGMCSTEYSIQSDPYIMAPFFLAKSKNRSRDRVLISAPSVIQACFFLLLLFCLFCGSVSDSILGLGVES